MKATKTVSQTPGEFFLKLLKLIIIFFLRLKTLENMLLTTAEVP